MEPTGTNASLDKRPAARAPSRPAAPRSGARPFLRPFSFPALLGALLAGASFLVARLNLPDPDTWWHVAVGERILATRQWPTADIYSFTAHGAPWIAYEWLGEVPMALAARLGGVSGLTVLLVALSATLMVLLYYFCARSCGNTKAAFASCAALLPLATVSFRLRPQLCGYIFLLAALICLERFRQGHARSLWLLPPIFALWVNTHGTFVFGLLVLGAYWTSGLTNHKWEGVETRAWTPPERQQLAVVGLLSVLALLATPYGAQLAAYPVKMAASQPVNIGSINEWQAMPFNLLPGKMFLGFLVLFLMAMVTLRPTFRAEQLGLLFLAIYAASVHRRFLPFFIIMFAPLLSSLLARWAPPYNAAIDPYALNAVLIALLAVGTVLLFPTRRAIDAVIAADYPQQAVDYLRRNPPPGPLFNQYDWGGYLIWTLGPRQKVFVDGRSDLYEYSGVLQDSLRIADLDSDALPLLGVYGVRACLIGRNSPLATLLNSQADWKRTYSDNLSSVFVRDATSTAAP